MNTFFPRNFQPQARVKNLLTQNTKDETLIYDLATNQAFCLNSIASAIWSQCDGKKDISKIVENIKKENHIDSNEELILLTLNELNKNNLLVETGELQQMSGSFNRREVIKRIGLSTAFALPAITSLIAPMATHAQSQPQQAYCSINCNVNDPNPCSCTSGNYTCPNGGIITIDASAGICLGVGVGINIPGIPINVGAGVCVYTGVCVSV